MNIKFKAGVGIRNMSGWETSGSSRFGMKKIGSGQAARMPTPGLKLRKKSLDLFKEI